MTTTAAPDGTVGKALDLLDIVAAQGRPTRLSDISALSGRPKATAHRLLRTLTKQGMLSYDPTDRTYSLGLRLVRLAHTAWRQASLAPMARAAVDALSAEVGQTIHLAQLDQGQVLYVDKRNAVDPVAMHSEAGKISPAYCTGVGKAMLAFLPPDQQDRAVAQQSFYRYTPATLANPEALRAELAQIRMDGLAFDREEHEPGIVCVAAPILASGRMVGGLSVTSAAARRSASDLACLRPALISAAAEIGGAVAAWRFPVDA